MTGMQIVGIEQLEKEEKEDLKKLSEEYFVKIQRNLNSVESLILHVKEHNKEGKRKKFSLHLRAIAPTHIFEADAIDWDLRRTLHKLFDKLDQEIEHRFHVSDQHKR